MVLIPKREFGRGKKVPVFGHATVRPVRFRWLDPLTLIIMSMMFIGALIDWQYLHHRYGFYIPYFYEWITGTNLGSNTIDLPSPTVQEEIPTSVPTVYQEEKQKINDYLKEQARKRYKDEVLAMCREDPEMAALIDGKEPAVVTSDKDTYEFKKKFIADFLQKMKAETITVEVAAASVDYEVSDSFEEDKIKVSRNISNLLILRFELF